MIARTTGPALAGAAALLLLAGTARCEEPEKKIEKKIVVISAGDDEHEGEHRWHALVADRDLDCHEADGKKICVSRIGPGHHFGSGGTFLGVELTQTSPDLREHFGAPREAGVMVSRVEDGSPAQQAGIQVGDILTALDGEAVASAQELRAAVVAHQAGDAVAVELYRDGRLEQLTATLAKREPADFVKRLRLSHPMFDPEELSATIHEALEGIDLEDLDEKVRKELDAVDWEEIRETIRRALDSALER